MASPTPPIRAELDDIADRLLALRRMAAEKDEVLVTIIDIALLHVAQQGVAGGVVFDVPALTNGRRPVSPLSAALGGKAAPTTAKPEKPFR